MAARRPERLLAEAAGACTGYDACPGPGGLVYNIDGYAEEASRYPWMSRADWGFRAVAAAASDVVASGGVPEAVLYSVGARSLVEALEVARGVREAAEALGARVLKADYNSAAGAWIDVAVAGRAERPVPRTGARPGHALLQVGLVGYGAVESLTAQHVVGVDEALSVPGVRRRLPPPAGPLLSRYAEAASDNSDGWVETLYIIAEESRVTITLEDVLVDEAAMAVLEEALGPRAIQAALYSWEDYAVAAAVPEERLGEALAECKALRMPCAVVGRIKEGPPRVYWRGTLLERRGWYWRGDTSV